MELFFPYPYILHSPLIHLSLLYHAHLWWHPQGHRFAPNFPFTSLVLKFLVFGERIARKNPFEFLSNLVEPATIIHCIPRHNLAEGLCQKAGGLGCNSFKLIRWVLVLRSYNPGTTPFYKTSKTVLGVCWQDVFWLLETWECRGSFVIMSVKFEVN